LQKTKAILLHQMKSNCLDDLDFGGALIFLLLLGGLHLLVSTAPAPGTGSSSKCRQRTQQQQVQAARSTADAQQSMWRQSTSGALLCCP
jgi:hypothetical protein